MSYRDSASGYDPNAFEQQGKPLRPFNWVQWTGVAIGGLGVVLTTLDLLGEIGWIPQWLDDSPPTFPLLLLGLLLVNSRREPSSLAGSEQLERNRKLLLVTVAICALVLGIALVVEFGRGG